MFRRVGRSEDVHTFLLLLAAAFVPLPEEAYQRVAHAARRTQPIVIDGKLDEPAWQDAHPELLTTQAAPDEGQPPTVRTEFRVLWDDEYFYLGAVCDDPEPLTVSLTRRDRYIEGDYIQFDLDTTYDRRTAYHFQVYASGTQQDGVHFNDNDTSMDWDAAWESAVVRTPGKGWSVEIRIPLRVLRIPEGSKRWGFNIYRVTSRRHEEDQWRFRPNGRPGNVSRLGILEGLDGIHPVKALELKPYVSLRADRTSPEPVPGYLPRASATTGCLSEFSDPKTGFTQCVGADFRYNLSSDLALVGTVNPDFGQVEADQRVLNLTTFETFFPEKRPFFLEGLDLFKTPLRVDLNGPYGGDAYQIFYSRRIGRATPTASDLGLASDQTIAYQQATVPVASAIKLSGTIGGTSVGLFSALEPRVTAQIARIDPDGRVRTVETERTVEARNDAMLRVRAPIGSNGFAGMTLTSVDPLFASPALGLNRTHAHVGEGDLTLFTSDRHWQFDGQALGSLLTGNAPTTLIDGTYMPETASGGAFSSKLKWVSESWFFNINGDYLSRRFSVNDLGFMPRANLTRMMGYFGIQSPHPQAFWQNAQMLIAAREIRNADFDLRLERDAAFEVNFNTPSGWFFDTGVQVAAPYVDDRELGDGTPIERQGNYQTWGFLQTDSRKPVQLQISYTEQRSYPRFERVNQLDFTFNLRPLPQLDGSLDLAYNENAGTFRQIRTATTAPPQCTDPCAPDNVVTLDPAATYGPREYLLAQQHARSVSATLRGTYSFTPRLTLQAYAQFFAAGIAYGDPYRAFVASGKPTVTLASLVPAGSTDFAPDNDDRQAGLNVNVILRWEWRTGSTFYLVYAHRSSNDISPPPTRGLDFGREIATWNSAGVVRGDSILVKVDLLSAL
jgi:hypothetical protein